MRLATTLRSSGLAILAAAFFLGPPGALVPDSGRAHANGVLEERKMPMRFVWNDCGVDCPGWISAIGVVTSDTPRDFDEFSRSRNLTNAAIVLDSSGGSVNDSIALGRRWRKLGLLTTVGTTVEIRTPVGERPAVVPGAYCESMCVFLLLSGKTRYVPDGVYVRVHQIWMGDRAENARASTYSAQDMMIVERDIGRLAKFTFDMGGTGDLLLLALNVPPWEELHTLSRAELQLSNLYTTDAAPDMLLALEPQAVSAAAAKVKPLQDRLVSEAPSLVPESLPVGTHKTAQALPTGGSATKTPQN
ncbi:MAG: hypothetical protein JWP21_2892 [Tardiphaga sp.]|nr:hypothetical protein [Tardiphaga sp.]